MAEGSWIRIGAIDAHLDARTVNSIIKDALGKKAISITQNPELRQKIGEAYIEAVTPFVPIKSGKLRESGRATTDGRVYWTATNKYGDNYAGYVYDQDGTRWPDGEYSHSKKTGTYPRWTEKIHPGTEVQPGTPEWDAFINNASYLIREAFKDE